MDLTMSQDRIDRLNAQAATLIREAAMHPYFAYVFVARDNGLAYVRHSGAASDGGPPQCELWRAEDGTLVNLWADAATADMLGFDDQVGWADEEENSQ